MTNAEPKPANILDDLFEKILARPPLYVGYCSIIRIGAFMDGYAHAGWEAGEDSKNGLYKGFNEYVARRFKIESAHNWVSFSKSVLRK